MLRLYKLLPDGRRQITGFLSAGHLLGLAPEGVCVYTAEAITEVSLCRYKRKAFDRLIDEVPGFAKRLLAVASHELCAAQNQMLLLGRKAATEKVASFLLLMADQQGKDGEATIDVPMTRNDIADYLGLTIETVSRTLTKLRQDGLIALPSPDRIKIRDRDAARGTGRGRSRGVVLSRSAAPEGINRWTRFRRICGKGERPARGRRIGAPSSPSSIRRRCGSSGPSSRIWVSRSRPLIQGSAR